MSYPKPGDPHFHVCASPKCLRIWMHDSNTGAWAVMNVGDGGGRSGKGSLPVDHQCPVCGSGPYKLAWESLRDALAERAVYSARDRRLQALAALGARVRNRIKDRPARRRLERL